MCQQIIILAERPGWRYISQCEHGTVHLVWDSIGLHLPAEPFGQLAARMLETQGVTVAVRFAALQVTMQQRCPLCQVARQARSLARLFKQPVNYGMDQRADQATHITQPKSYPCK